MNAGGATAVDHVLDVPIFIVASDGGAVNPKNLQDNLLIFAIASKAVDVEAIFFAMEVYAALLNGSKTIQNPSSNDIDKLYFL